MTNDEMLKDFLMRLGTRQDCPLLPFLFIIVLEVLAASMRQAQEIKGTKVKLIASRYDCVHRNLNKYTDKLLSKFNSFNETKVKIKKNQFYINSSNMKFWI